MAQDASRQARHWRSVAEEVARETDPAKLQQLIQELCDAFEEKKRQPEEKGPERLGRRMREEAVNTDYTWYKSYMAAVLETDWTKIHDRLQAAEAELFARQRLLSENSNGTEQEKQALAAAINGINVLRKDVAEWQKSQSSAR